MPKYAKNKGVNKICIDRRKILKKALLYLFLMILGNIFILIFYHNQDNWRFLALFGFLLTCYSIIQFSFKFISFVTNKYFSYSYILSKDGKKDKSIDIPGIFWLVLFISLVAIHVFGYINLDKKENALLRLEGVEVTTTVTNRKWISSKGGRGSYHICYEFSYNGKLYHGMRQNETLQVGDTITVKFLPQNPHNNTFRRK